MSQKTETLYKYYILETSKTVHYMHVVMVILNEQRFYLFIYFWLYESLLVKWCLCFFLIFIFFYFSILYWFCHISTWICHGCTRAPQPEPPSHLPPPTIPLGSPSAPAPSILYHASNLDWRFISYMILCIFQCHSPKSSHPLPLPQSP